MPSLSSLVHKSHLDVHLFANRVSVSKAQSLPDPASLDAYPCHPTSRLKSLTTADPMSRSRISAYLHVEYQPGERALIRKIDFFILTFCCLSYFINYVRPTPITLSSTRRSG